MKRLVSLLLTAAILMCSCTVFAFAEFEPSGKATPLVVVSGFATVPLVQNAGSENAKKVWAPAAGVIVKCALGALAPLPLLLFGKWDEYMDRANPYVLKIFEPVLCDENGDSVHDNVSVKSFTLPAANYPDFYDSDDRDEQAFVKTAIETLGSENVYFFSYDWRLDPVDHAKQLKAYIDNVKSETKSESITLAGCSMGGTVILSYLMLYGSDGIKNFILDDAAFQGTALVGELFRLDLCFDKAATVGYIDQFVNNKLLRWLLLNTSIIDKLIPVLDKVIDNTEARIGKEVMYPVFAQMPGMWSLVDDASYEEAKTAALDKTANAQLIKRIDRYHYDVQGRAKELLNAAKDNDTNIFVLANYGFYGVPITSSKYNNNDILVDTKYASGGATCADIGKSLGDDYMQSVDCGHNHISPDRAIDASTCIFPENTWFTRGMKHLDYPYGTQGAEFLMWLVQADGQYTVQSNPAYPQFMQFDVSTGVLSAQ